MGTQAPAEMVWVDLETTGLDPGVDVIMEIGLVITDEFGTFRNTKSSIVLDPRVLDRLAELAKDKDQTVHNMHTESGLIREILATVDDDLYEIGVIEDELLDWLDRNGLEPGKYPMCGNTINFDREFLRVGMPKLWGWFHYRNVDITSVKNLCMMLNPSIYKHVPEKRNKHRVIWDLEDSIEEYKFYLDEFLMVDI